MKQFRMLLLILFLNGFNISAQVAVRGTVTDEKQQPVEFAGVTIFDGTDTTKAVAATATDLQGNYVFESLKAGDYRVVVSSIGYLTLRVAVRVASPAGGGAFVQNFRLEADAKLLSEVTVEGQRKHQYIDKAVYTFTGDEVKRARYSRDLLEKLPGLVVDAESQRLKSLKSGSLLILINGVAATDNELKLLPPDKVVRVEYYDIPPARYAGTGAVANIITRELNDGYAGGIDLNHAFTTGFGNDNAYFSYHKGRNQLSAEYSLQYRDYKDRESYATYRYELAGQQRESIYRMKDKFGYTINGIGLKYTNQSVDNHVFQVSVKPNFQVFFNNGGKDISYAANKQAALYDGKYDGKSVIFNPVVDFYYWKRLAGESEISANVVGSMFRTSVKNNTYEYRKVDGVQTLKDEMRLENRKRSLIGEIVFTKKTGLGNWNSGYKLEMSWLDSDIDNLLGKFDYASRYAEHYLYSEFSGGKGKLLYRLSLGGKAVVSKSYSDEYRHFVFTPRLMFGYQPNEKHSFRMSLSRNTVLPSVSDLSNNAQVITPDIISKGNPLLVNAVETEGSLSYVFANRYFNLDASLAYDYTDKAINQFFTQEAGSKYIALTKENAVWSKSYGGDISLRINPLGTSNLSVSFFASPRRQELESRLVGRLSNWYLPFALQASYDVGRWSVGGYNIFTSKTLAGAFLSRTENGNQIYGRYKLKKITFSVSALWLFTVSRYPSETVPGSLVSSQRNTQIKDNRSMFVFGLSWNFSKGKEYTAKRTLENKDTDSGTF